MSRIDVLIRGNSEIVKIYVDGPLDVHRSNFMNAMISRSEIIQVIDSDGDCVIINTADVQFAWFIQE